MDPIQEGDRYLRKLVLTDSAATTKPEASSAEEDAQERKAIPLFGEGEKTDEAQSEEPQGPKIVDLEASVVWGPVKHSEIISGTEYKMSKKAPGAEVRGRFYLTRNWIVSGAWAGQFYSFSGNVPSSYNSSSIGSGTQDVNLNVGYRFLFMEDQVVPAELTLQLGYRRFKMKMDTPLSAYFPSAKSYKGLQIVFGGLIPVVGNFSAFLEASKTLGGSLTEETKTSGASSSNSVWDFRAGGQYRLNAMSKVVGGIKATQAASTFEGQGTRANSATSTKIQATGIFAGYSHSF
jgi:hypothetical protein